jgi:regulator of replication initiation timing
MNTSDQNTNSGSFITSSVRETDSLLKKSMQLLSQENMRLSEENERLQKALEEKQLLVYTNEETTGLVIHLKGKLRASEADVWKLKEKLKIANRNYVSYLNKYIALAERLRKQNG